MSATTMSGKAKDDFTLYDHVQAANGYTRALIAGIQGSLLVLNESSLPPSSHTPCYAIAKQKIVQL